MKQINIWIGTKEEIARKTEEISYVDVRTAYLPEHTHAIACHASGDGIKVAHMISLSVPEHFVTEPENVKFMVQTLMKNICEQAAQ